jgi:hypothetical protein
VGTARTASAKQMGKLHEQHLRSLEKENLRVKARRERANTAENGKLRCRWEQLDPVRPPVPRGYSNCIEHAVGPSKHPTVGINA